MPLRESAEKISADLKAAADSAALAFDNLNDELKNDPPDVQKVLTHSGQIWASSVKVWANLVLAPGMLAAEVTKED